MTDQPQDQTGVDEAAAADHQAVTGDVDRTGPAEDGAAAARADGLRAPEGVAAEYSDMLERGAAQKGEGRTP